MPLSFVSIHAIVQNGPIRATQGPNVNNNNSTVCGIRRHPSINPKTGLQVHRSSSTQLLPSSSVPDSVPERVRTPPIAATRPSPSSSSSSSHPNDNHKHNTDDHAESVKASRTLLGRIFVEILSLFAGAVLLLLVLIWRLCHLVSLNLMRCLAWLANIRQLATWAVAKLALRIDRITVHPIPAPTLGQTLKRLYKFSAIRITLANVAVKWWRRATAKTGNNYASNSTNTNNSSSAGAHDGGTATPHGKTTNYDMTSNPVSEVDNSAATVKDEGVDNENDKHISVNTASGRTMKTHDGDESSSSSDVPSTQHQSSFISASDLNSEFTTASSSATIKDSNSTARENTATDIDTGSSPSLPFPPMPTHTGRRVILVRHAKTEWTDTAAAGVDVDDHARGLSVVGRNQASAVGSELRRLGWIPDTILCSDAVRTVQTLDLLLGMDSTEIAAHATYTDTLYYAVSGEEMALAVDDALAVADVSLGDRTTLLIVCHNPGCEELVEQMTGHRPTMGTACAALLQQSEYSDGDSDAAVVRQAENDSGRQGHESKENFGSTGTFSFSVTGQNQKKKNEDDEQNGNMGRNELHTITAVTAAATSEDPKSTVTSKARWSLVSLIRPSTLL